MKRILWICFWILLHTPAVTSAADDGMELEADSLQYDRETATYRAIGNVFLQSEGKRIQADSLEYSTATGTATASGDVRFSQEGLALRGNALEYNLSESRGRLGTGELFIAKGNFHLHGEGIERESEGVFRFRDGTFTTCDGVVPDWKFRATDARVTVGGYASGWHVRFYLKNIPVFYLPYIIYPIGTDRQSGFLVPGFGASSSRGTELNLAYYQVLGRNMDATLYADHYSEWGRGWGLEYRYVFGTANPGEFLWYQIDEVKGSPDEDRYGFQWRHLGNGTGWQLRSDVLYATDREYLGSFSDRSAVFDVDRSVSTVSLSRGGRAWYLSLGGSYTKEFEISNAESLHAAPRITGALLSRLPGGGLSWSVDSSAEHLWRDDGFVSNRYRLLPGVNWGGRMANGVGFQGDVEGVLTRYSRVEPGEDSGPPFVPTYRLQSDFRVKKRFASGPVSYTHIIEPKALFLFTPDVDQDALPDYDSSSLLNPQRIISLNLSNRLLRRTPTESGREVVWFSLQQKYDLNEASRALANASDRRTPFDSLLTEVRFRPLDTLAISADASYDWYRSRVDSGGGSFSAQNRRQDYLKLSYRYSEGNFHYVGGESELHLSRSMAIRYLQRYDLRTSVSLEKELGLRWQRQCWEVLLTASRVDGETRYRVSFNMLGLGQVGEFSGRSEEEI